MIMSLVFRRNSVFEIEELLTDIVELVFHQLTNRHMLSLVQLVEPVRTVQLQRELFKHAAPRRDNQESCFRLFNIWKGDEEPLPLGVDTLSCYSVPFHDSLFSESESMDDLDKDSLEVSIVSATLNQPDQPKQPTAKTSKAYPLKRPLTGKIPKNQNLIPLKLLWDNEPEQIERLRREKASQWVGDQAHQKPEARTNTRHKAETLALTASKPFLAAQLKTEQSKFRRPATAASKPKAIDK